MMKYKLIPVDELKVTFWFAFLLPPSLQKLDVSYGYIVDQQPIGKVLFRQFCENKRPEFYKYIAFLESVSR